MGSWSLYFVLVLVRIVVGCLLPGYVHPDEFFQGGQELFYGCPPYNVPWEFQHDAVRSIVPPSLMAWLPLQLYHSIMSFGSQNEMQLSGWEILILPRLVCGIASVASVDLSIYLLSQQKNKLPPTNSMWVFATSWPTWVILTRPFTNGLETIWLACLMMAIAMSSSSLTTTTTTTTASRYGHGTHLVIIVGVLCALGVFTRFTFIFFVFPTMIVFLWQKLVGSRMMDIIFVILGFGITSLIIIWCDMIYYERWVLTPLNALLYNAKVDNLETHGLHPRWTHAVVNMMMLFGPMTLIFYTKMLLPGSQKESEHTSKSYIDGQLLKWTVISGLAFLSFAPHQEPRFLTPLVIPLTLLVGDTIWQRFRFLWIFFNLILLLFFGVLHQGGVISSLRAVTEPTTTLFLHTYMPPSFLIRQASHCTDDANHVCLADACPSFIQDLGGGADSLTLRAELQRLLQCNDSKSVHRVRLVAPPLRMEHDVQTSGSHGCYLGGEFSCRPVSTHWPHLTTEDFPTFQSSLLAFLEDFALTTYEVSCAYKSDEPSIP